MSLEHEKIVRFLANKLQVKRADLKKALEIVAERYGPHQQEYENILDQDSYSDARGKIAAASRALSRRLIDSPEHVKQIIDLANKDVPFPGFYSATRLMLNRLENSLPPEYIRTDGRPETYGQELKHKTKIDRNNLIVDLAGLYVAITNCPANTGKDFKHFMEQACKYLDIPFTGIVSRHKRLHNLYPDSFK
jgi:hypothetical protein